MFSGASPNFRIAQRNFVSLSYAIVSLALICALLLLGTSCSTGLGQSGPSQSSQGQTSPSMVAVSPATVTVAPSSHQQFTATIVGSSNTAVTWSASAGSISSTGLFTAPASETASVVITAASVANPTQLGKSLVSVRNVPLTIETSSLAGAVVSTPYDASLSATGGVPPYSWAISAGTLPSGVSLQASTGSLAGTTNQLGNYPFTAKVTDSMSNSATQVLNLGVTGATACGSYDGPAELPCVYLQTTMADTPAPGSTFNVRAGGDLQTAVNNADCGDTIQLQAGATFTGKYILPAKSCDSQHWIIIRTSASDSSLPPEGTRMTPCYAGVSSLPGRPAYTCTSPQKLLATISYPGTGDGPIQFANGANHYRLIGLEITRVANDGMSVVTLVAHVKGGAMNQIVLDRLYIHGTPSDETRRGVQLSGGTSVAVQDSYISDLHCSVMGTCIDAQAVSGGTGILPGGPYKIDDNFLESSGENILFGGDAATQTPADIEIRFNHLFKPMFWMQGQPGFKAPAFIVKNHFELKNAQRVLFDSNILDDNWGGFSQHGYSILLTPKNQDGDGVSVCPLCEVTDVTIRYSTINHVAGAVVMGNDKNILGGVPRAGERYSMHDVIVDDLNGEAYNGRGTFAQIGSLAKPLLQDVEINHITAFPNHVMFNLGAPTTVQIPGFIFGNSIVGAGDSPVTTTGDPGGLSNCAYYQIPIRAVPTCFANYTFSHNAILDSPIARSDWPRGNFYYSTSTIGFVNYNNGNGGDYHLLPSSPAIGAASDGTNLGADVDAVLSAINGVQ
jgi:putative Ig domain-containing protein